MDRISIDLSKLFSQLGRANDIASIKAFIDANAPMSGHVQLHEAAFWTASQAAFLRDALLDDAEWAAIVDALNSELHSTPAQHG